VYRVDSGEFGRSVQPRPAITVEIYPIDRAAWRVFARHHYMSADLSDSAQCFGAWCNGTLADFIAYVHQPHARVRNIKRITRTVVLPDWQGLGFGLIMSNWLGQYLYTQGYRLRSVTAHPVQAGIRARSPRWREVGTKPRLQVGPHSQLRAAQLDPRRLNSRVFEYCAPCQS
jgi:GNAT superfamily N-acetyltransferase